MAIVHHGYRILHRPASRARVLLNGVPLYDRIPESNVAPSGPITHGLVPGENSVDIALSPSPPSPDTPLMGPHFLMTVFVLDDAPDETSIWRWEYPDDRKKAGIVPELPCSERATFVASGDLPEPIWARASREELPPEGTPELHRAVADLHHAFASKDARGYLASLEPKFADFERYYGARPGMREEMAAGLEQEWRMHPLDPQDLRFDRYLDGRVVFARRLSGKPAVGADHATEPFLGWGSDLYLTRLAGTWRIYR